MTVMAPETYFRKSRGTPSGGQFATHVVSEADFNLSPTTVTDALGNIIHLRPGFIDDNARYAYQNGQCFALAAAVSRLTGWPIVMRVLQIKNSTALPFVHHVWAQDPEGTLIDIAGGHDPEVLATDWDEDDDFITVPVEDLDETLEHFQPVLPRQVITLARTFVPAVFDQYLDDIEAWLPDLRASG
jgi:hypothetical protein